jgi:hypothetical protein
MDVGSLPAGYGEADTVGVFEYGPAGVEAEGEVGVFDEDVVPLLVAGVGDEVATHGVSPQPGVLFGRPLSSGPGVVALGVVAFPAGLLVVAGAAHALECGLAVVIGLGFDVIAEP